MSDMRKQCSYDTGTRPTTPRRTDMPTDPQQPAGLGDVNSNEPGSGARFNAGKPTFELVPLIAFEDCARVFDYGRKKYAEWNWAKGMPWSAPLGCLLRHMSAWQAGENNDAESGLPHLAHAMANLVMLSTYARTYPQGDDRTTWLQPTWVGIDLGKPLEPGVSNFDTALAEQIKAARHQLNRAREDVQFVAMQRADAQETPFFDFAGTRIMEGDEIRCRASGLGGRVYKGPLGDWRVDYGPTFGALRSAVEIGEAVVEKPASPFKSAAVSEWYKGARAEMLAGAARDGIPLRCTGDPGNCPENNGAGCCNPNPQPSPAEDPERAAYLRRWEGAPDWAMWLGQDDDGAAAWFDRKPLNHIIVGWHIEEGRSEPAPQGILGSVRCEPRPQPATPAKLPWPDRPLVTVDCTAEDLAAVDVDLPDDIRKQRAGLFAERNARLALWKDAPADADWLTEDKAGACHYWRGNRPPLKDGLWWADHGTTFLRRAMKDGKMGRVACSPRPQELRSADVPAPAPAGEHAKRFERWKNAPEWAEWLTQNPKNDRRACAFHEKEPPGLFDFGRWTSADGGRTAPAGHNLLPDGVTIERRPQELRTTAVGPQAFTAHVDRDVKAGEVVFTHEVTQPSPEDLAAAETKLLREVLKRARAVGAYDWSENDEDAVHAVTRLADAVDRYEARFGKQGD
jgi:hypothetical protein